MAAYAGAPLPKKLGIAAGTRVALVGAPAGFEGTLRKLPEGATLQRGPAVSGDLVLWFVRSRAELESGVSDVVPLSEGGRVWIVWPKRASGVLSDLTQQVVREAGLAAGMVDFKVASVDETWSGLRFTRRQ
jgi:hypothetical protein